MKVVAASAALVRLQVPEAPEAMGVLTRAVEQGPSHDRIYAISVAPLTNPNVRAALVKASGDHDDTVALAALGRLVETPVDAGGSRAGSSERRAAAAKLLRIANGSTTRSLIARGALSRGGVREVAPYLHRDVASTDLRVREAAGTGLVEMGELGRAAPLVADPDERVRTTVACAIVRAPPSK